MNEILHFSSLWVCDILYKKKPVQNEVEAEVDVDVDIEADENDDFDYTGRATFERKIMTLYKGIYHRLGINLRESPMEVTPLSFSTKKIMLTMTKIMLRISSLYLLGVKWMWQEKKAR